MAVPRRRSKYCVARANDTMENTTHLPWEEQHPVSSVTVGGFWRAMPHPHTHRVVFLDGMRTGETAVQQGRVPHSPRDNNQPLSQNAGRSRRTEQQARRPAKTTPKWNIPDAPSIPHSLPQHGPSACGGCGCGQSPEVVRPVLWCPNHDRSWMQSQVLIVIGLQAQGQARVSRA